MANAKQFDTWEEAFNYCREADHPVVVRVDGETAKIYPSGAWKPIKAKP